MSLQEKIMKMPLWKTVILVFFLGFLLIVVIEEIFISKIFAVMDGMVTRFEQTEKEEQKDWDNYEKSYEAFNKKSHDDFESAWNKQEEEFKQSDIRHICEEISRIKLDNKLLSEMESKDYKQPDNPIIRADRDDFYERLKNETKRREKLLKSDIEMLAAYKLTEKKCDEIKDE